MYAKRTKVPVSNTRAEIERLLERRGATGFAFGSTPGQAMLAFEMQNRRLRFLIPMPHGGSRPKLTDAQIVAESKRRWRALLLVLKAKLEAVESKITTLDEEFLAHIVVEGNTTVGDRMVPAIEHALASGGVLPPLLGPAREP